MASSMAWISGEIKEDASAILVQDLGEKEAILATHRRSFFTIPHFEGYPAVLVRLDNISLAQLQPLVLEAWLCRAPKRLAKAYL